MYSDEKKPLNYVYIYLGKIGKLKSDTYVLCNDNSLQKYSAGPVIANVMQSEP